MDLKIIDWCFIFGFFALALGIGLACTRQAGKSASDFFLSGRNMPWWLLGKKIAEARRWGTTEKEKEDSEYAACKLHTIWSGPNSGLNGYANAEWSGLLKDYYRPRWQMFIEFLLGGNNGEGLTAFDQKRAVFDAAWRSENASYPVSPAGDTILVSRRMLEKYKPLMDSFTTPK